MELKLSEKVEVLTNSSIDGEDTTIDQEDLDVLVLGARENIYSNPIQTCAQEYINNARDACRDAGHPDHLMDISWPTPLDMVFRVRDYGTGLSDHAMKTVFNKLAKSTKRANSKLAGKYGLGSKIGLAYTDGFTITSWYDGEKRQYLYHKASNQKGRLTEISEPEKTEERNGLMIEVGIRDTQDIEPFRKAILRACGWWPTVPNIVGLPEEVAERLRNRYLYEDENIAIPRYGMVSEGGLLVDYLPYSQDVDFRIATGTREFRKPVYFKVGLHEVHIPMSREGVSVDDQYRELLPVLATRLEQSKQRIMAKYEQKFSTVSEVRKVVKEVAEYLIVDTTITDLERRFQINISGGSSDIVFEGLDEIGVKRSHIWSKIGRKTPSVRPKHTSLWWENYSFATHLPTDHRLREIKSHAKLEQYNLFTPEVYERTDLVDFFNIKPLSYEVERKPRTKVETSTDSETFRVWEIEAASSTLRTTGIIDTRVSSWSDQSFLYIEMDGTLVRTQPKDYDLGLLANYRGFKVIGLPAKALKAFKASEIPLVHLRDLPPIAALNDRQRANIFLDTMRATVTEGTYGWFPYAKSLIDPRTTDPDLAFVRDICELEREKYDFNHCTPEYDAEVKALCQTYKDVITRIHEKHRVLWHLNFSYSGSTARYLKGWFK